MNDLMRWAYRIVCVFVVSQLTACTPLEQPVSPRNQTTHLSETHIITKDGTALPYRQWNANKPKAIILALHGFNDYSKSFTMFAEYLKPYRIMLMAYDQRGFGKTEHIGIWGGTENLTNDVCDALENIRAKHKFAPIYVLGDSMGASVAINAYQRCKPVRIKGLIMTAPAVWGEETMNLFFRATLWALTHTFPEKLFTGEGLRIKATDNIEVLRDMSRDPYVIKATRADAIYGLLNMMDEAHAELRQLTPLPILILYGENDEVIPPHSVDNLAEHLPYATRVDYDEGYHMLLRDLQRENVYNDILHWIKETAHAK